MPTQTTTTTQGPPAYLQPFLEGAANAGTNLYNQGPQQFYPGQSVVPFSSQTQQAMGMQQQRAMQGSPLIGQAQNFAQGMLQGNTPLAGMAQGGANPYLDQTFNRAAGAVNRSMDTVLARSGRDLTGNLGARSDQLNNLATNIYGNAYESDANRRLQAASTLGSQQLQAAGQSIPLAREDYFDIGQLGQVGQQVEGQAGRIQQDNMNRWNFANNAPWENLNRYMGVLSGAPYGGTTTQSTPMHSNPLGGALGGAATAYGAFGNPYAALAGGVLGYFGSK